MHCVSIVIEVLLLLFSFGIGIVLFSQAQRVLLMQTKFYAKLNWKIKPISMEKEVRFTRKMGKLLLILASITTILIIIISNS